jgi:hypothetical protein
MDEVSKRNFSTINDVLRKGVETDGVIHTRLCMAEARITTLEAELREIKALLGKTLQAVKGHGPTAR